MKILAPILVVAAAICGVGIGAGTAVLQIREHPWKGGFGAPASPSGGQAVMDQEVYDFGKLDTREDGKHEFVLTNRGDRPLTLSQGRTSCACTISQIQDNELAPGKSTKVLVSWRSKGRVGAFQQSVTIVTSDPIRPDITLTIQGEYTRSIYIDPDELAFGQIGGTEAVTRETRILCNLRGEPIAIKGHHTSDPSLEKFFQIDDSPLTTDELSKHKDAISGVLVHVTVKPGLPLGPFQQRIFLNTNAATAPELELYVFGTVGEVSLVGAGWNSDTGVLDVGPIDGPGATQRRLVVLARGATAKQMRFKVASVDPGSLKVTLGKTVVSDSGLLSQTELLIDIPAGQSVANRSPAPHRADKQKLGEIILETTGPPLRSTRIRLRFGPAGGS